MTTSPPPPPNEQCTIIKEIFARKFNGSRPLKGETYYLVDALWWNKWTEYVGFNKQEPTSDVSPGEIDNIRLLERNAETDEPEDVVKGTLLENTDYVFVPDEAWTQLQSWYGGGPPIARKAVAFHRNPDNILIEIRLLRLKIVRSEDTNAARIVYISKTATVDELHDTVCQMLNLDKAKCRLVDFHADRYLSVLDSPSKTLEEVPLLDNQKVLVEEKDENGRFPERKESRPLYGYYSYYSDAKSDPGKTGLVNLGNTCFMNSALQCLSAAAPLTDFILSGKWRDELNRTNPLGTEGKLTEAYAALLEEMWSDKAVATPSMFKHTLERFAPQFAGYQQHDSQELLAYVLDGLHEDLNRIQKKPYVETVEAGERSDEETAIEAWKGHKLRNDSIIVDYFHGQLKSRLECPECGRVSVTFDPFMYLSLPLPVKTTRKIQVTFFWRDGSRNPVRYFVTVEKSGTVADMKRVLSEFTGLPVDHIALTELWQFHFHRVLEDRDPVSNISSRDIIAGYEVLTPSDFDVMDVEQTSEQPAAVSPEDEGAEASPIADEVAGAGAVKTTDEEEIKGEEEEEEGSLPVMVHIPIIIKRYERTSLDGRRIYSCTGDPFILSIPPTITYKQLYQEIINHTARLYVKPIPPLDPEQEEEMNANKEEEEKIPASAAMPHYNGIFDIYYSDIYGNTSARLRNNGKPLKLKDRQALAIQFEKTTYEQFYSEEIACKFDPHPSCEKEKENIKLDQCLDLFTAEEMLGEDNMWYCNRCKDHKCAKKKFDLWKLPPVLVVHLKRFRFEGNYAREKLSTFVDFPIEGLDLSPWLLGPVDPSQPPIYDLFAVSNHFGNMGGGHYTAYARHRNDGKWYLYDDRSVSAVENVEQIKSNAAYVLFYRRRDITVFDQPYNPPTANSSTNTSTQDETPAAGSASPATPSAESDIEATDDAPDAEMNTTTAHADVAE